jgi:signal transduction histidine kinase
MPKLPAIYRGALILAIPLLSVIITVYGWMWSRQEEAKAHWWVNHAEITISLISYFVAVQFYRNSEGKLAEKAQELAIVNASLAETNANLANRNQELDQFTYIVSHDLKAPLRAIANLSEWLEEDLADKLDEDTSQQLILLRQRVFRMDAFIDGLLRYSRAGRLKEAKTIVDVKQLLEEIIDSLNPPPEFTIKINGAMPIFQTEALPLQQVLSNLISNGIKHNPNPEGKIEISLSDRGFVYQFAVADNGEGIPSKYHNKIFEIFQTLTSREEKESTGIGLSIVRKIVENQGGKIWLESQEGRGTTFYFTWLK